MCEVKSLESILKNIPIKLRNLITPNWCNLEEIRLRINRPITLETSLGRHIIAQHTITHTDIQETLELMSESSIYAFLEEIRDGFLTIQGGHRIGICGRAILQKGTITNITNISGINIRIAKEIIGAADGVINPKIPANTLIISPPNCGKTTVLRDIARQIGNHHKICIIDERGEIAAMHQGHPQYDIGSNTDVLDLCPKSIGINMMLRSMSPEVLIADEIATSADVQAIKNAVNCGVTIIASAHGSNLPDVLNRLKIEEDVFENIAILKRENGSFTYDKITRNRNNPHGQHSNRPSSSQ